MGMVGLLVLLLGCIDGDAPVSPGDTRTLILEVPRGASARSLTDTLVAEGLVPGEWSWRLFLRGEDAGCLKAGRHEVSPSQSMRTLLTTLCGVPIPDDEPFTVVEGSRIVDIDAALAARGWIEPGEYAAIAAAKSVPAPFEVPGPTYEGFLFPDTYRVEPDRFEVGAFITRQLTLFDERVAQPFADRLGERTLPEVVVMASMIEREEPTPAQRPIVAGILWKRLDHHWKLGVDATSRYRLGVGEGRREFLAHLRDPDDPYNTRLRHGLPPTPINNPGVASLEAAVSPESSPFWYYLHDGNGVFHGGKDAAEHAANRRRHDVY